MRVFPLFLLAALAWAGEDRIDRRMAEIRATPAELRWRLIPLEPSMMAALEKAKAQRKPLFYFAADGVLDAGNC